MATSEGPTMSVHALSSGADPRAVTFIIKGRIGPEDATSLCNYVCTHLQSQDPDRVICDLGGVIASDASTIEALARLQLASHRRGCTVELSNASRELLDLLDLVGLTEVVPSVDVQSSR